MTNHFNREKNLVLEELCKQKAKMDTKNKNGLTALYIAVSQKDSASVDVLVNFGADVNVQVRNYYSLHVWAESHQ